MGNLTKNEAAMYSRLLRLVNPEKYRLTARRHGVANRDINNDYKRLMTLAFPDDGPANDRRRSYGISEKQYAEIVRLHNGVCALCGKPAERLVMDHDHDTGKIRGLLHRQCNAALGVLGDNPEGLRAALEYVERQPSWPE